MRQTRKVKDFERKLVKVKCELAIITCGWSGNVALQALIKKPVYSISLRTKLHQQCLPRVKLQLVTKSVWVITLQKRKGGSL